MRDVFWVTAGAYLFVCLLWVCDRIAGWWFFDE